MVSSTGRTITSILLVLGAVICIQAQATTQKTANGSISGKVTIKGKPAVGVMVIANDRREGFNPQMRGHRARTDEMGNYRITNLSAGTYGISTSTPALAPTNQSDLVVVADGEGVQDINISLAPGGVVTGKITDFEGEPLIGQPVRISVVAGGVPSQFGRVLMQRLFDNMTDDRGVYRAFGLPPGKYKVSVGESNFGPRSSREYFKETFYPSVTDAAKATVIEVTEGSVANDIDIVIGRPLTTFRVAGRVVDGETERPVPNIRLGLRQTIQHDKNTTSISSSSAGSVNANGEFQLENLTPGSYTIYTDPAEGSDVNATSVTFELVDRDLTDLLMRTTKGGSLSGVVVLDGNERAPTMLSDLRISASVKGSDGTSADSRSSAVGQNGTFSIHGVRSGPAYLSVSFSRGKHFEVVRVEHNGSPTDTINVKAGEHVAGIRVTVKYVKLTGAIRGQIKVENGELPPPTQMWLSLWPLDENLQPKKTSSIPTPERDARGRFFVEGLPAGTYQLRVYIYPSARTSGRTRMYEKTQQVTVADDTVTEVTLIIQPPPNPN